MENILNALLSFIKRKDKTNSAKIKKDFLFCRFFQFIEFNMDFQKVHQKKSLNSVRSGVCGSFYMYMSFHSSSGERMPSNAQFFTFPF